MMWFAVKADRLLQPVKAALFDLLEIEAKNALDAAMHAGERNER